MKAEPNDIELLAELKKLGDRLVKGQLFNSYESDNGWLIGIGPVTDFLKLAGPCDPYVAGFIVHALRYTHSQPEILDACNSGSSAEMSMAAYQRRIDQHQDFLDRMYARFVGEDPN